MSAGNGHPNAPRHFASIERELKKLLARPDVQAYMNRKWMTNFKFSIPLTGGSSIDGLTYYIDPNVAPADRQFVLVHERVEKALRAVMGMTYDRAHELATAAERLEVEKMKKNWAEYKTRIGKVVRVDEKEAIANLPANYDYGPMKAMGMVK